MRRQPSPVVGRECAVGCARSDCRTLPRGRPPGRPSVIGRPVKFEILNRPSAQSWLVDSPSGAAQSAKSFSIRRLRPCAFLHFEKGSARGRRRTPRAALGKAWRIFRIPDVLGSQFSNLPSEPDVVIPAPALFRFTTYSMSKGWRNSAVSSPPFHVEFESTKSSKRRFSCGCCLSNSSCARWASSRSVSAP